MKNRNVAPEVIARAGSGGGGVAPTVSRRRATGAEIVPGGVHFRVWAPDQERLELVLGDAREGIAMERDPAGYFACFVASAGAGTRYRFRLDDGRLLPDPASRHQPDGPHGASEVVDPATYVWSEADRAWRGIELAGQVFCEIHIGTFTKEGTYLAAIEKLDHLKDVGITAIELMPVAEFSGRFGWGYDGVTIYAPYHEYGTPDDLRRFVDEAHRRGLAVVLDVVYNHLGPDGNYLPTYASCFFSKRETEWGRAINYDGQSCGPVREHMVGNAVYWIEEFHFDGLRLDATQSIFDTSPEHVIAEIARRTRAAAQDLAAPGKDRSIVLVAENEPQHPRLVRPRDRGGYGLDGLWNDDVHHTAVVAVTGRREAYYTDYLGSAQELVSAAKYGYLYQGQRYEWQRQRRGESARGVAPQRFVAYLENHDQVANSLRGERLWQLTSPGRHRAITAYLLLAPPAPLLFQGQEFSSSAPFLYFAEHEPELAALVRKGRAEFVSQFPSCATPEAQALLPDPAERSTLERCRLDWAELADPRHQAALALHRDLLRLRREDATIAGAARGRVPFDGAVLAPQAFVLRWLADDPNADRLLVVNLGPDLLLAPAPEPLLAPPDGTRWGTTWSSELPKYGGGGAPKLDDDERGWRLPAESAALLAPEPYEAGVAPKRDGKLEGSP